MHIIPEILDLIIDHLHDDIDALSQCSIVCKDWRSSTNFHLFSTLWIGWEKSDEMIELLETRGSAIIPHVRKLIIHRWAMSHEKLNRILGNLPGLPAVDHLVLRYIQWENLSDDAMRCLRKITSKIAALDIMGGTIPIPRRSPESYSVYATITTFVLRL